MITQYCKTPPFASTSHIYSFNSFFLWAQANKPRWYQSWLRRMIRMMPRASTPDLNPSKDNCARRLCSHECPRRSKKEECSKQQRDQTAWMHSLSSLSTQTQGSLLAGYKPWQLQPSLLCSGPHRFNKEKFVSRFVIWMSRVWHGDAGRGSSRLRWTDGLSSMFSHTFLYAFRQRAAFLRLAHLKLEPCFTNIICLYGLK